MSSTRSGGSYIATRRWPRGWTWSEADCRAGVVEYHSETAGNAGDRTRCQAPLTDLCPPPRPCGRACVGHDFLPWPVTVACPPPGRIRAARTLRRRRRQQREIDHGASFRDGARAACCEDMSPQELSRRVIWRTAGRRTAPHDSPVSPGQAATYAVDSLLGDSSAMRKVRAQVAAAAASGANVLICGPARQRPGTRGPGDPLPSVGDARAKLIPIDCAVDELTSSCGGHSTPWPSSPAITRNGRRCCWKTSNSSPRRIKRSCCRQSGIACSRRDYRDDSSRHAPRAAAAAAAAAESSNRPRTTK